MALFPGKIHFYHGKGAVPSNIDILFSGWIKIIRLTDSFKMIMVFGRPFQDSNQLSYFYQCFSHRQ